MAPEAIDGHSSAESDVYSFGVLVVEIASGQEISSLPSEKLNEKDLMSFVSHTYCYTHCRSSLYIQQIKKTLYFFDGTEIALEVVRIVIEYRILMVYILLWSMYACDLYGYVC